MINYTTNEPPLEGFITLNNNEVIRAFNITISHNDSNIFFDEPFSNRIVIPTKNLVKIQMRNHLASTFKGLGYGILGGAVSGGIIAEFTGRIDDVPDNTGRPNGSGQGPSRFENLMGGAILGALGGAIIGAITGGILGQWEDIYIKYD